jgi:hypothetical protein
MKGQCYDCENYVEDLIIINWRTIQVYVCKECSKNYIQGDKK